MSKLKLSVAVGNYDRVRPLMDGAVQIDGVDPVFMNLPPEEIFFRAFRNMDFDICELSMSSFTVKVAEHNCPYVGVPAFVSRAFRHNSIYVRRDRIKSPADLKGKRVGLPEYQLTACVWVRIILEDDHGVKPSDIVWVRGGIEHPGRPEKIAIKLPADVRMEDAPQGATISSSSEIVAPCGASSMRTTVGSLMAIFSGRPGCSPSSFPPTCAWKTHRKAPRSRSYSSTARSMASSPRACQALPARTMRISAGCFRIRLLRQEIISNAPASFPSCISPVSVASWWRRIRGCRRLYSRRSKRQRRSALPHSRTPPRAR